MFGIPIPLLSIRLPTYQLTYLPSSPLHSSPSSLRSGLGLITGRCTAQNHDQDLNGHLNESPQYSMPSSISHLRHSGKKYDLAVSFFSLLTSSVFVICRLHLESSVHLKERKGKTRLDSSFMTTHIARVIYTCRWTMQSEGVQRTQIES